MENLTDCKAILARMHPRLVKTLDVKAILPFLNQADLITEEEREFLLKDHPSTEDKINKLVSCIPRKGPGSLQKFITCLKQSASGTGHLTIAKQIEAFLSEGTRHQYDYTLNHALDKADQKELFHQRCIQKIIDEKLNINIILPSLLVHGLITLDEEKLLNIESRKKQLSRLKVILPSKESNFLSRFVVCLDETLEEAPNHLKIKTLIKKRASTIQLPAFLKYISSMLCDLGHCCFNCLVDLFGCLLILAALIIALGKVTSYGGINVDELKPVPFADIPKRFFKGLPQLSNHFVGREEEMNHILDALSPNSRIKVVGIFGGPGFGKSTLAIKASERLKLHFDMTIEYYDLTDVSFVQFLMHIILGPSYASDTEHHTLSIIEDLKHWAHNKDKSTLLVFNDCDKLLKGSQRSEMQKLCKTLLQSSSHIKILYTSRVVVSFLDGFKSLELNQLPTEHATELLEKIIVHESSEKLKKIAMLVGNVPLALQVVGVLLETKRVTSDHLIEELSKDPIKTLSPDNLSTDRQINTSLHLSYQNLDKFTQMCAKLLANWPGSFSEDAALTLIQYMVNKTYWYAEMLIQFEIFLHWNPKPMVCIENLVNHSLLKFHLNSKRYSFHKLIQKYLLQVKHEKEQLLQETFEVGFFNYFVDYWNSFHTMAEKANVNIQNLLAAMDMERHNFELMERLLPQYGGDISYLDKIIDIGESLAISTSQEIDHMSKEVLRVKLHSVSVIVLNTDYHSKIIIKKKGIKRYMKIFVGLLKQRFILEKYIGNERIAFETLISRQHRIVELYDEYEDDAFEGIMQYFEYIANYLLHKGDIDRYIEVFQTMQAYKSQIMATCSRNALESGIHEFSFGNYQKAALYFQRQEGTVEEYFYAQILLYYCFMFQGDAKAAMLVVHRLEMSSSRLINHLVVAKSEYTEVVYAFYKKMKPRSIESEFLKLKLKRHAYHKHTLHFEQEQKSLMDSSCFCG